MKNTKSLHALSSVIIGLLMTLLSITYLPAGGLNILIGVFALLTGLFYGAVGFVFLSGLDEKNEMVKKWIYPLSYMVYACYYFIFDLTIIIAGGTQNFEAIGWIMIVLRMLSSLLVVVLSIVSLLSEKNEKIENICSIVLTVFVCSLIVGMVFDNRGNQIRLGNIQIASLVILVCYTYIANIKNQKIISGIANQFTSCDKPKETTTNEEVTENIVEAVEEVEPITTTENTEQTENTQDDFSSTEVELMRLKELYDRRIISEEEYNARRTNIINNLM